MDGAGEREKEGGGNWEKEKEGKLFFFLLECKNKGKKRIRIYSRFFFLRNLLPSLKIRV